MSAWQPISHYWGFVSILQTYYGDWPSFILIELIYSCLKSAVTDDV